MNKKQAGSMLLYTVSKRKIFFIWAILCLAILFATGFLYYLHNNTTGALEISDDEEAGKILILVNQNSADSIAVGRYYQERRNVPSSQIVYLDTSLEEKITMAEYTSQIKEPVKAFINDNNLRSTIRYIVPTYGVPSNIDSIYAVDSQLADLFDTKSTFLYGNDPYKHLAANNPYSRVNWGSYKDGTHASPIHLTTQGIYLVSRLDGTSLKIAKGLVDKAIYAGKYTGPAVNNNSFAYGQPGFIGANNVNCGIIRNAGYNCKTADGYPAYDSSKPYDPQLVPKKELSSDLGGPDPLWLITNGNEYFDIWGNWRPGSIPIHFQSFTAPYSIRKTDRWWMNAVSNLLAADATATTGTVTEPYATALPQPPAFFDYFLNGNGTTEKHFNFAESMYMSSLIIKWTNIVIGDPLYKLSDAPATDTEAPKIENVAYSCQANKANVYWSNKTGVDGSPEVTYGSVKYGETTDYGTELWDQTALIYYGVSKKNYLSEHSFQIDNMDCSKPYYFKITAVDPESNTSEKDFILNKPNELPVISAIDAKSVDENSQINFNIQASDPDNDELLYSVSELPFGASFNAETHSFSWTPGYNQSRAEPYVITFTVDDQHGGGDTETVLISVNNVLPPGPVVVITTPASEFSTLNNNISINYTVDGEAKVKEVRDLQVGDNTIEITEASKLDTSVSTTVKIVVNYKEPLVVVPEKFSTGWNMISFPDLSAAVTSSSLLPNTLIRRYDSVTRAYVKSELGDIILTPGAGYWIRVEDLAVLNDRKYAQNQVESVEVPVVKGWNLLGNPYQSDILLASLLVKYKDGSILPFIDAVNRKEVASYVWSWESSIKQYYFIAINPDNYKVAASKQTIINSYRGFWMIVKSDQINGVIFNK